VKFLLAMSLLVASFNVISQERQVNPDSGKALQVEPGATSQSIEDVALTYFREIAYIDQQYPSPSQQLSAKDILRDRDGLTEVEAEEVIAVARQLEKLEQDGGQVERTRLDQSIKKVCSDLRATNTPEQARAVLEVRATTRNAENRSKGAGLLGELNTTTRAHVITALNEYRKGVTVVNVQWKNATAEQVERYRTGKCASVN
jgi:hypothetical protein